MFITGSGVPIVVIPGLHGRWEWGRPAIDALSRHHRVITFSLCDERSSPFPCEPAKGFENYVEQVEMAMDRAGVQHAVIAGISFGGLIASEFTARHPDRVSGLVLASALHASWEPNSQQQRYLEAPILMSPLFAATAPSRMHPEMAAAFPAFGARLRFALRNGARAVMAPTSPVRMARRIAWAQAHRFSSLRRVTSPALIVTGEPGLDRIVPVDVTLRYLADFDTAEHIVIKHTGHFGSLTRPDEFAGALERFMDGARLSA